MDVAVCSENLIRSSFLCDYEKVACQIQRSLITTMTCIGNCAVIDREKKNKIMIVNQFPVEKRKNKLLLLGGST